MTALWILIIRNTAAKTLQICLLFVGLAACSSVSYDAGKFRDDLPSDISSIYLQSALPFSKDFVGASKLIDTQTSHFDPSIDAEFIAKIIQSNVARDLRNKGYNVTYNPVENHDIDVTFFLFYQPDEWPIANRYIHLGAEVSKPNGQTILYAETSRENWFGFLGDYAGFSGEDMMADAASRIVALILSQL